MSESNILELLKKAKRWELELFAGEYGVKNIELYMDDVIDIIDSIKYLREQNKRYREIIQDFIDHAEDYNIARVEEYSLRKALEGEE